MYEEPKKKPRRIIYEYIWFLVEPRKLQKCERGYPLWVLCITERREPEGFLFFRSHSLNRGACLVRSTGRLNVASCWVVGMLTTAGSS